MLEVFFLLAPITSGSTMLVSTSLVLDAGGNANAVWVFRIGTSLTTGANVSLANGAQAQNVFWVPTQCDYRIWHYLPRNHTGRRKCHWSIRRHDNGRILAGAIDDTGAYSGHQPINVPLDMTVDVPVRDAAFGGNTAKTWTLTRPSAVVATP